MNTKSFSSASDLVAYVNDNSILQASIVTIVFKGSQFWLFWYT